MAEAVTSCHSDDASLVLEERFAVVPEWLLDAPISDCAVRLYAVLLRYGQVSGARMPSRATLARRLRKKSTDTVDRALRELVELGAVSIEARWSGRERLTNAYRVRTSLPRPPEPSPRPAGEPPVTPEGGGRTDAAIPAAAADRIPAPRVAVRVGGGRTDAAGCTVRGGGGRTDRVGVAAQMRHNPEFLTERTSPPPPAATASPSAAGLCGVTDWAGLVAACQHARRRAGLPVGRWSGPCLDAALQLAVRVRQWPADQAAGALLALAGDPETRSPMRLAEAGPWWDGAPVADSRAVLPSKEEVASAEAELEDAGGLRLLVQRQAREQLAAEGRPVQRATVAIRALDLLHARQRAEVTA